MNNQTAPFPTTPTTPAVVTFTRRSLWIAGGVTLVAVTALAAALTLHRGASDAPLTSTTPGTQPATLLQGPAPDDGVPPPRSTAPAEPRLMTQAPKAKNTPSPVAAAQPAAPAVCAACGTVESVQAVKTEGHSSGVGAVAGGLLGGVLGNQIGGGNGRKAMTVIGAVGGGVAGNEIEKRHNATTSYRVTVRKDDGTRVTLTRSEPWTVGTRVSVDGSAMRTL